MSSPVGHRRRPRPLVPGKTAPVSSHDVRELLAARARLEEAKRDIRRATERLQRQLGDAELGTWDGQVVLRREQARTGGGYVRVNHRDDLRVISPAPVLRLSPAAQAVVDQITADEDARGLNPTGAMPPPKEIRPEDLTGPG